MNARTRMIGIAACAAAILAGGCAMTKCESAKGSGAARIVKVACLGDSLTSGMNMADPEREKYPAQLDALADDGVEVKGFAIPGRTALRDAELSVWKEDYFQAALKWDPDVVVICLGANDCWPAIWSEHGGKFKKDLGDIVAAFARRPSRPRIWLATPMPFFIPADRFPGNVQLKILEDETVPAVKEVAAVAGVGVIDLHKPMQGRRALFFPDGVHPNPAGAARMAERVWEAVEPAVAEARAR